MPRFAANISLLFSEYPLIERFAAARTAGFERVELLFPYEISLTELKSRLSQTKLDLVLINTPAGDWEAGERGLAAVPGKEARFREDAMTALRYAQALDVNHVHVMAGASSHSSAEVTFIENLRWVCNTAPDQSFTIEPINPIDMPGYILNDFDQAARILDTVAATNLHLQFDAYHAHRITGDVLGTWAKHGRRAIHIQIAGFPGRHEPFDGEIDYPAFFETLDHSGYNGVVSAEYHPIGKTDDGLSWLHF